MTAIVLAIALTSGVYIDFAGPNVWLSGRGLEPNWNQVFVEGDEYRITAEYPSSNCNDGDYRIVALVYVETEDRFGIRAEPAVPCYDPGEVYFLRYTIEPLKVFSDGFESGGAGRWSAGIGDTP